jgi:mono/diheme cytochrome c family protein
MRGVVIALVVAGCLLAGGLAAAGGRSQGATRAGAPTYYRDVAPILDAKCASCHSLGGIAPFSLTTAAQARAHAKGIVLMTRTGAMPPWMPGSDSAPIVGSELRRLTSAELSTLTRWAAAGAPAGNAGDRHSQPTRAGQLTGPGRTITLAPPKPYLPHTTSGALDDYHCFLLDPKLTSNAYLTGALIRPQRRGIVHHVILFEATGAQATAAERLNAASGGKGWTCFGGPNLPPDLSGSDAFLRLGSPPWLAAWVPGHVTNSLPDGTGELLHAGAKIVMQVHYNLIEAAGPDRSQAVLRIRPATTPLTDLQTMLIAAPVELACPAGAGGPDCNRQRALQDEVNKYGAEAAFIPNALLRLCDKTLADFPTDVGAGTSIDTSCVRSVDRPMTIYGVGGHMHLRGRDISVVLDAGTPKQQTLLHIPAWDFHWQDVYFLQKPVTVGPGDTISVRCRFDNSRNAQPVVGGKQLPPRYVLWGEGTTDEMCLSILSVAFD